MNIKFDSILELRLPYFEARQAKKRKVIFLNRIAPKKEFE